MESTTTAAPDTHIINIAAVCHEANRAYCATLGDLSQPAWADAPDWQRESAIKGVLGIRRGEITRPEQSHESWSAQKVAAGWVYGEVKDAEAKTHPCLVPYAALPPEQQAKDALFFATARALLGWATVASEEKATDAAVVETADLPFTDPRSIAERVKDFFAAADDDIKAAFHGEIFGKLDALGAGLSLTVEGTTTTIAAYHAGRRVYGHGPTVAAAFADLERNVGPREEA